MRTPAQTAAPATASPRPITYKDVRIHTRKFRLYGHLTRYRYQLRPGPSRKFWGPFHCTRPFLTREEAQAAGKEAIDERLFTESQSRLHTPAFKGDVRK